MCECGCASTAPDFQFKGPKGIVYSVQFYSGCHCCSTGAAVIVQRWTTKSAKEWGVDRLPDLPIQTFDRDGKDPTGDCFIPTMDPDILKAKLCEFAKGAEDYDLDGFAQDAVDEVFYDSAAETFDKWNSRARGGKACLSAESPQGEGR